MIAVIDESCQPIVGRVRPREVLGLLLHLTRQVEQKNGHDSDKTESINFGDEPPR